MTVPDRRLPAAAQLKELLGGWSALLSRDERMVASALGSIGSDPAIEDLLRGRIHDHPAACWDAVSPTGGQQSEAGEQVGLRFLRAMLISRLHSGPLDGQTLEAVEKVVRPLLDCGHVDTFAASGSPARTCRSVGS